MYRELYCNSIQTPNVSRPIFPVPGIYIAKFKILSVNLCVSWDPISSTNNKVNFVEAGSPAVVRTAVIAPGTYYVSNMEDALASAMTASGTQSYTVTYSEKTRSLTISASAPSSINGSTSGSTAHKVLGISRYANTATRTTLTLPNTLDMTNNTSSTLSSGYAHYLGEQSINCLASIDVTAPTNGIVTWENGTGGWLECAQTLQMIDFVLVDSGTGNVFDTRGQNFFVRVGIYDDAGDVVETSESMSDEQTTVPVEEVEASDVAPKVEKKKSAKVKMTPAKLANLAAPRAARAEKAKKMSVSQR
ncbi:hypothetical protein HDV00_006974 [Rhizophlyctis rosea]|nr:hypothetical protein HDV00_006974 [Rhizophlyctis rosea]